jgi:hypothetical protein
MRVRPQEQGVCGPLRSHTKLFPPLLLGPVLSWRLYRGMLYPCTQRSEGEELSGCLPDSSVAAQGQAAGETSRATVGSLCHRRRPKIGSL